MSQLTANTADNSSDGLTDTHRSSTLESLTYIAIAWWLAWPVLLIGGFVWGLFNAGEGVRQHIPIVGRIGSSLVLVVAAWAFAGLSIPGFARFYAVLVAVGMTLGFWGDVFNAGLLPSVFKEDLVGGIVCFGLGHIAYIVAFWQLGNRAGLDAPRTRWSAIAAWQVAGAVGWFFVVLVGQEAGFLHWAALPYSLLLAGTAGVTTGLALGDRRLIVLGLGGALFLVSDLLLAFEQFRGAFAYAGDFVWLTYGPAQMLLVFGTLRAFEVLALARRSTR